MSQEKIERMAAIAKQIDELAREGMVIADETGTTFSLESTTIASTYGLGGLEYYSQAAADKQNEGSSWTEYYPGWRSSASDSC